MHEYPNEEPNVEIEAGTNEVVVFTSEDTTEMGYVLCCLTSCIFPFNILFLFLTDRTTYVVNWPGN